jgi:MEMO1 family protein
VTSPATRPARFAGSWYPGDPDELRATLSAATPTGVVPAPARAVISPHAGYRFSLGVAAETMARVVVPRTVVVLCPNHTVPPPILSLWAGGSWETPLGEVPIDEELARAIARECPGVTRELSAHRKEHAIELQLPILQQRQPDLRLVPLVVAAPDLATLQALGEGIATAIQAHEPDDVLLVASTDMTHFETAEVARAQDERALARVEALDPAGLLELCVSEGITMCGVRPTTAVLYAALALGATSVERVRYANSGDVSGDHSSVVGYAGLVVR